MGTLSHEACLSSRIARTTLRNLATKGTEFLAKAFVPFVLFGGSIYFGCGARGCDHCWGGVVGDRGSLPSEASVSDEEFRHTRRAREDGWDVGFVSLSGRSF